MNVDECVREAELSLCGDIVEHALNITKLENPIRVSSFRNKNADEIINILTNCRDTIKRYIIAKYYKDKSYPLEKIKLNHTSDNNKIGADLYHILPSGEKIDIEVKFGAKTDRNIGMAIFDKIFGCAIFSKTLSVEQREKWKALFIKDESEKLQFERLNNALNEAVKVFNDYQQKKNNILLDEEQDFMEDYILNSSGGYGTKSSKNFIKFILEGSELKDFKHIPTGIGHWIVQDVYPISSNCKRINVYVMNYDTNIQIKYTLNWKNNYFISELNKKVPAKLGFGSSNWNVWVEVEITELSL